MNQKIMLPLLAGALLVTGSLSAAPRTLPGLENGMLKIQNVPSSSEKQPDSDKDKIVNDRRNVEQTTRSDSPVKEESKNARRRSWSIYTPVPANCLAAKLTASRTARWIKWSPMPFPDQIPSVRLPAVSLSQDQSVLAIVETTGEADGPNGSRIVLFNTHTWQIIRLFETDRAIERITFPCGDSASLYAVCKKQSGMKQPFGIAEFDLDSGKEQSFIRLNNLIFSDFLCDQKGRIFLSDSSRPRIVVYTPDNVDPSTLRVSSPGAAIALSPDGKSLAAAGRRGRIEIFKTSDLRPLSTVNIPSDNPIKQLVFLSNRRDFLCTPDVHANSCAFAVRNDRVFDFPGFSSGILDLSADGGTILHLKSVNGEIDYLDAGTFRTLSSVFPEKCDPKTKGAPRMIRLMEASGVTLVLDESGNLYALYLPKNEKRYQKQLIVSPWK